MRFCMDLSEREFLVFRIRSGAYKINYSGLNIRIVTPTIEQELEACEVYNESYYNCLNEDIMTEDECFSWMIENYLWSYEEEGKIKEIKKEIENRKVDVYKKHNNARLRESARALLRSAEIAMKDLTSKKNAYQGNTCEGLAQIDKSLFILEECSYVAGKKLEMDSISSNDLLNKFYSMMLSEEDSRELARSEPWKSIWALKNNGEFRLFSNKDRELSIDQKNLLVWSTMYDNIQESVDCPSEKIISDDDALDGWFIEQKRKQEKDKAVDQIEQSISNPKIRNSQEIIVFTDNDEDARTVNDLNSINAKMIKAERNALLKQQGKAKDLDFKDQRMRVANDSHEQFKNKFRR